MSMQPPWPGQPVENSENNAQLGQPAQSGYPQPDNRQSYPQGQPHPGQSQQPGQFPQGANPYAQPYYGAPSGMPPLPKKKSVLPWILVGGGVAVMAVTIVVVVLIAGMFSGGKSANVVEATTTSAYFQYPEGWIQNSQNVTVINEDGSKPAERFSAINTEKDASALFVYEAGARPEGAVTQEKIHKAIDQGFAAQLDASQDELIYMRGTSGFGCVGDFAYTQEPATVERDGMYGYSYGYTCLSYKGAIEGEYFVAYDNSGVSHRLTVEALASEWNNNKQALTAIIASLRPAA